MIVPRNEVYCTNVIRIIILKIHTKLKVHDFVLNRLKAVYSDKIDYAKIMS